MNKTRVLKFFFLLLLVTPCSYAIDVQLFRPNFDQNGGITLQHSGTIPKGEYRPGLFINWVKNPIEFGVTTTDSRTDELVGWFMTSDLLFAWGLKDNWTLGVDLPVNFGSQIEPVGSTTEESGFTLGDIHLFAKYRMHEKEDDDDPLMPSISVTPFFSLPTGKDSDFFGHKSVTGGFRFAFDWMLAERHKLYLNLGTRLQSSQTILNLKVGSEFLWGLGYDYLVSKNHDLTLALEFVGSTTFAKFMTEEISSPVELLIALQKPFIDDRFHASVGIGRGGNNGYGSPDFRFFVGASYACQHHPSEKPVRKKVREDRDGDNVMDEDDLCPDTSEDMDQFEDADGCPDNDNDHDSVEDANDKCPKEAETINGMEDADGCPDEGESKVRIQDSKIVILEKIYFVSGKDMVMDRSIPILMQISAVVKANPQVTKLRIGGYTDSQGSEENNQKLSQLRADKIREYLINSGVSSDRLDAVGYGEINPVDTNATPQGRDNNRRVEFTILESK